MRRIAAHFDRARVLCKFAIADALCKFAQGSALLRAFSSSDRMPNPFTFDAGSDTLLIPVGVIYRLLFCSNGIDQRCVTKFPNEHRSHCSFVGPYCRHSVCRYRGMWLEGAVRYCARAWESDL